MAMHALHNACMDFEWFKERKRELKLNDAEIGAAIGRDRSIANKLLSGRLAFDLKYLPGLALVFRVRQAVILFRAGVTDEDPDADGTLKNRSKTIDDDSAVPITSLDLSLSMGPGTLIEEFIESEPYMFDLRMLQAITRTPSDRLRMVRGIGDSMEPTLRTGDQVLVNINERTLGRMGIYWIDYLGAHGIKRLRPSGKGKVMIMSDNPVEPDFEADAADLRIEGRVIWFGREL